MIIPGTVRPILVIFLGGAGKNQKTPLAGYKNIIYVLFCCKIERNPTRLQDSLLLPNQSSGISLFCRGAALGTPDHEQQLANIISRNTAWVYRYQDLRHGFSQGFSQHL